MKNSEYYKANLKPFLEDLANSNELVDCKTEEILAIRARIKTALSIIDFIESDEAE